MDMLQKLFPRAFAATEQSKLINALIVYIVIAVVGALVGFLVGTLLGWIPVVGFIIMIVWCCTDSTEDNQWGPNPKNIIG